MSTLAESSFTMVKISFGGDVVNSLPFVILDLVLGPIVTKRF